MSAASAKASLLLAMLSIDENRREDAFRNAKKVSQEVLDHAIAEVAVATDFGKRLATHVLVTNSETLHLTTGEIVLYTTALAPVIEGFAPAPPHEIDAMYDVRWAAGVVGGLLRNSEIPADTPFEECVTIARGALIWYNTNPGVSRDNIGERVVELKWLGSKYRDITSIARELIERRSSDPMLITDLLRKESASSLRDGVL